jgi:hypothetical protein
MVWSGLAAAMVVGVAAIYLFLPNFVNHGIRSARNERMKSYGQAANVAGAIEQFEMTTHRAPLGSLSVDPNADVAPEVLAVLTNDTNYPATAKLNPDGNVYLHGQPFDVWGRRLRIAASLGREVDSHGHSNFNFVVYSTGPKGALTNAQMALDEKLGREVLWVGGGQ